MPGVFPAMGMYSCAIANGGAKPKVQTPHLGFYDFLFFSTENLGFLRCDCLAVS